MKIHIGAILVSVALVSLTTPAAEPQNNQKRPPTVDEIMKIVVQYETILNKDIPSGEDFYSLYSGDAETERSILPEENYCKNVLNLEPDTLACNKAFDKMAEDLGIRPDLFLLNTKNILSGGVKGAIKFYISPHIDYYQATHGDFFTINTIALIGDKKYRSVQLVMPRNANDFKYWKIDIEKIDGKYMREYPFTITKPLTESK